MGVVYEAEQLALGRHVALKVLAGVPARSAAALERFQREARAAARLHHTNIVPVFEVGRDGDAWFYAVQFIHGQALDEVLDQVRRLRRPREGEPASGGEAGVARSLLTGFEPPTPQETKATPHAPVSSAVLSTASGGQAYHRAVARIGLQVAEALDYAHREGVLHRDVKPSNLLFDTEGRAWVADFGLAKSGDSAGLTETGDLVGTLRYMAPERFEGRADARSDVYALGLTLFELLALRPAFDESDRARLVRQVTQAEPARLGRLDRAIPGDLETIVHRAIELERERPRPG